MREFTMQEVIEYAQKLETESYQFYKKIAATLKDPGTVELAENLSAEEEKHYNQLTGLLTHGSLTPEDLNVRVTLDQLEDIDKIVSNSEIPEDTTALGILNTALEREKTTEQLYGMLLAFTDMNETMVNAFEDLKKFEQNHVARVSAMIERVK